MCRFLRHCLPDVSKYGKYVLGYMLILIWVTKPTPAERFNCERFV